MRNTLGAKLCDLIIGYAPGDDPVQNTNPYYRSAFVLVVQAGRRSSTASSASTIRA